MKKIYLFLALSLVAINAYSQLSGNYFIPNEVVGENHYASLSAAVADINSGGLSGNVILYINDDIIEANDIYLGANTNEYSLTIKPAPECTPTITFQSTATTIKANLFIGSPTGSTSNLVPTKNFIIDGSNTVDGTSKDLTIQGTTLSAQKFVIQADGDNDNLTIKNTNIINKCSNSTSINACVWIRAISTAAPDNLTLHNNTFASVDGHNSSGLYIAATAAPSVPWDGMVISNNVFDVSQSGMNIKFVDNLNIYNNVISVNSAASKNANGIILQAYTNTVEGVVNIYNNIFTKLITKNIANANNNGIMGIDNEYSSPKTVNIYNNTVAGLGTLNETVTHSKIYGIRSTGTSTCNIFHNTVYIPEMIDMEVFGSSYIAGIVFGGIGEANPSGGTTTIKNNIIVSDETGMKSQAIRRVGTGGTFISSNNVFYASDLINGYIGIFNDSEALTLTDWQTVSSQDANSIVKQVNFTDAVNGDLSLAGASVGDKDLAVPIIDAISTDILGNPRNTPLVYAGAYEPTNLNVTTSNPFALRDENVKILVSDACLTVFFDGKAQVELYNINGVLIDKKTADNIYTNYDLSAGIYLIRIQESVYKIIK
jgi:hypothetical protein